MKTDSIINRIYLSGIDSEAFAIAKASGFGFEETAFCWAPMMEDADALRDGEERAQAGLSGWFHAPFAELIPCSIDPLAVENTRKRYRQAIDLALKLGYRRMVFHGGFIPQVYFPQWYVERTVLFWENFLNEVPEDVMIALENVMEPSPETLVSIVSEVNDKRLGLCLDVGHANTNVSKTAPIDWVEPFAPYLKHVHLHNNDGDRDLHRSLGDGTIDMEAVLKKLIVTDCTFTLEDRNCAGSIAWLKEKGFI